MERPTVVGAPAGRGRRFRTISRLLLVVLVSAVGLAGCGYQSVQEVPLPGGAVLGSHPYDVTALLSNVVDLVPNASVRTNDVPVGVVREVRLAPDGWTAEVRMSVNGDVTLPANATANLRQTSLLGEKFVELAPPTMGAPQGKLANGAVIPLDRTDVGAQVEEVLGALSLLLNGGGVEKIQTISRELNAAMSGNEDQIRSLVDNLNVFVGSLNQQRGDIVRALDSVDRLSRTLVAQRAKIANVLDNLQPGLDVLNQQRGLLVGTLQSLQRLSGVATDVINRSQANTVADLQRLEPILGNLIAAGDALPGSLQILLTIPFADNSLTVIKGDYANIDVSLQLSLSDILNLVTSGVNAPGVDQVFALLANQQVSSSAGTTAAQAATNQVRRSNGVPLAIPGLTSGQGSGN
ncbi:MCE family protein [Actinomycetospora sp. TBRC 11914]|uniref:MCE family protein n=1 Tax=Actinomycetospora sp. TBRC 11914 TaxID=2729387 RepID=UPI00145C7B42|nr:MCE family protein [Actinomycetospora sp. TBRC 11914]NMO93391.1 MCE family protein [Actinomycetospora sp. TBRC 11914]